MRKGSVELVKATKQFAQEQRARSWWHLWSTLAVLAALLTGTCLNVHWLIRLPCSIGTGLVLIRLFIIYHDYQHGTILRGSRLAAVLMRIYGYLTLNPPSIWAASHQHHHQNNCKVPGLCIGTFPVMTTQTYAQASWLERCNYVLARHPLTILLGFLTVFFYCLCLRPLLENPRQHYDSAFALFFQGVLITALVLFAPWSVLVLSFALPWMIGAAMGSYLFYAQHNFPDVQFQEGDEWDYAFAALKSSSYMTMNPVLAWFTGNIGYHHVHHLNARIPFYRLPETMAHLEGLQSPGKTSLRPWDIYRCLRLKLWDPAQKRMVSFKGT
jgi:omega-6 fatty acid desaturase (delta-12 desaturase)